jgi:hypothetical protein
MPTKNAPFYSCKAGNPDAVKSHRTRRAALSSAGEMGQIWIAVSGVQRQVHKSSNGTWMTVKPDEFLAADLLGSLRKQDLIN